MSAANPKTSALLNTTGDKRGNMFCCYYLEEPNPLKHVPVFLSQNWCLRSIQLRQKTKQVKASTAYSSSQIFPHAVWFLHLSLSLCFFFFFFPYAAPCEDEDCKKQQICEHTSSGISNCTCAAGFYGDKCEGIVRLAPADCSLQAAGQVESRLGYLKRSCAIPQEFGALPWKRLLWWWIIVIIKTDTASPSLLREPVAWCCE